MVTSSKRAAANATKEILTALAETGGLVLDKILEQQEKRKYKDSIRRLLRKELILFSEEDDRILIISEKGNRVLLSYSLDGMEITKSVIWDKKWRIVAFDIPEEKRKARKYFKRKLCELGFLEFQKSIYIYPYECEKEILFICELYQIGPFVKYVVAENISDPEKIIKHFNL